MIKKVRLVKQYKGPDGRYRPGTVWGALDTNRVTYLENTGTHQGDPVTTVHLDDSTMLDVVMSMDDVIDMLNEADE